MLSYQIFGFLVILLSIVCVYLFKLFRKSEEKQEVLNKELQLLNTKLSKKTLELEKLDNYIKSIAYHDELTSLLNKNKFFEMATVQFAQAKRYKKSLSLMMIDLDYFSQINEKYGHDKADFVLQEFSKLLQSSVRECDFVCRYGGEEFVIMLPSTNMEDMAILVKRLMKKIHQYEYEIDTNTKINVLASFGLVEINNEHIDINHLINSANTALLKAKESGRDCFVIYKKGM